MNFNPTEEQAMLKDSVAKFIQQEYDIEKRKALADSELGYSEQHWQTFAELGWLSVPFAEEFGGFGGNVLDIAVMTEEFGRGLLLEPFIETVVLFGGLLNAALQQSDSELARNLIGEVIAGSAIATAALTEDGTRFSPTYVTATAKRDGDDYVLSANKINVSALPSARYVICSARTSGAVGDSDGISLFLLDLQSDAVERSQYTLIDGRKAGNLKVDGLRIPAERLLGTEGQAAALIDEALAQTILAECAEAVGAMAYLNETTLEYTKVRKQFDMPIGSFQALQHRMVNTYIEYEQTRSLLFRGLISWQDQSEDLAIDLAALKVQTGRIGKMIASEAIQLHGGMGLTEEYSVGYYMKRLRMLNASYGDADYHQRRYNQLAFASA